MFGRISWFWCFWEVWVEVVCLVLFLNFFGIYIKIKVRVYYFWGCLVVIVFWLLCNIFLFKVKLGILIYFCKIVGDY